MKNEYKVRFMRDNILDAFNDTGKHRVQCFNYQMIDVLSWILGENDSWSAIENLRSYLSKNKKKKDLLDEMQYIFPKQVDE